MLLSPIEKINNKDKPANEKTEDSNKGKQESDGGGEAKEGEPEKEGETNAKDDEHRENTETKDKEEGKDETEETEKKSEPKEDKKAKQVYEGQIVVVIMVLQYQETTSTCQKSRNMVYKLNHSLCFS